MEIKISQNRVEELINYSKLLNKDVNTMLDEALVEYFKNIEEKLIKKRIEEEKNLTNLSYDEFWDGIDLD